METTTTTNPVVQEIKWPGRRYITKRATIAFDQLHAFFGETYGAMDNALRERGVQPQGMPAAIYYRVDEATNSTDLAAAVPVPADMAPIDGFELVEVPAGKALQVEYTGSYEGMQVPYGAMEAYTKEHGLRPVLMLEEYLNDPDAVPDPSVLRTNIIWTLG